MQPGANHQAIAAGVHGALPGASAPPGFDVEDPGQIGLGSQADVDPDGFLGEILHGDVLAHAVPHVAGRVTSTVLSARPGRG
jgi:hypothetical protein